MMHFLNFSKIQISDTPSPELKSSADDEFESRENKHTSFLTG